MKCKVIRTTLDIGLKNTDLIEQEINQWLKGNPEYTIKFLSSAGIGTKTIITTILYE